MSEEPRRQRRQQTRRPQMPEVIADSPFFEGTCVPVQHLFTGKVSGTPVFTGSRLPIQGLFEYLTDGESIDGYMESYPSADREQVVRLLRLAERMMDLVAYENSLRNEQSGALTLNRCSSTDPHPL